MIWKISQTRWWRYLLWLAGGGLLALLSDSAAALAAPLLQETTPATTVGLSGVLIPILTAAIGVERAIEFLWNYIEWFLLNFRRWAVADLKNAEYVQFKSGTSLLLGMIAGILLANYAGLRLLQPWLAPADTIASTLPVGWDALLTGLLIGAGSKPAHDILGIFTHFKNFLGNGAILRREEAGRALAEGVLRLAQSEAQGMVDVPGVGPSRLSAPGSRGGVGVEEEGVSEEERSAIERYAEILRRSTMR